MRPLSTRDVLRLWEEAQALGVAERPLALLAAACAEHGAEELARLPLGRREALLLELHRLTFGPELDLCSACPACGELLELELSAAQLLAGMPAPEPLAPEPVEGELEAGDLTLRFRPPDSRDLAAVAACPDEEEGRLLLVERCLLAARRGGEEVTAGDLGEEEIARLAAAIAELDPAAEVLLDLECAACGHRWRALLDTAACLWRRLAPAARHLLAEVHTLARAYGWREADILALSPRRRRAYLDLALSPSGVVV